MALSIYNLSFLTNSFGSTPKTSAILRIVPGWELVEPFSNLQTVCCADDVPFEVVPELRSKEKPQYIVVVVDGGEGDVQLGGTVRLPFAAGPPDELNLLDEIPLQGVQVLTTLKPIVTANRGSSRTPHLSRGSSRRRRLGRR